MHVLRLAARQTHRCLDGHPWIFRSEIEPAGLDGVADGDAVEVHDPRGRPVGRGFHSARSQIAVRLCTRAAVELDEAFLRRRLAAAIAHRADRLPDRQAVRLVSSEGDLLPGLVVERFADRLVVQALTAGIDRRLPAITALLDELCRPAQIVERSDGRGRELEGLPERRGVLSGPADTRVRVRLGGVDLDVDLLDPHKTGAYLDQIESHRALAAWAPRGGRVADVFAHRGGFALHLLQAGAAEAVAVDQSAAGLADASAAADRLGLRLATAAAYASPCLRGYRDLHLQALRLLAPGGRLASWSCSSHVGTDEFLATAVSAAAELRRTLRHDAAFDQPADHPWLPAAPETRYLKGFLVTVID